MRARRRSEAGFALLLLAPLLALIFIFIIFPLVSSFSITFMDFSLKSGSVNKFAGLENYLKLLKDELFLTSLTHTIYFTAVNLIVGVPLALAIALLLNEEFPGNKVVRVSLLVPWAVPPVVAALMFTIMMQTAYGVINFILVSLGIISTPIAWFGRPEYALDSLIVINLWKYVPLLAIILLSAVQNVPAELIESAKVYSANSLRRFVHITLPSIRPTIIVTMILSILFSLITFDTVLAITKGGPGYETYMLYFYAYRVSFEFLDMGYGSTVAYIVTFISVVCVLILMKYRRVE